jgi:lysozyme
MSTIEAAVSKLATEEGFREFVYDDATGEPILPGYTCVGHPTLWFGLCVEKGRVPRVPDRIPTEVLEHVVRAKQQELNRRLPWLNELPDATQLGLLLMAYQLGVGSVMRFDNMIGALAVGDVVAAGAHALDSAWARQTPARARRVAALIANDGEAVD